MKRMLMAIMAVAMLVAFTAPSFADDTKKGKDEGKKKGSGHVVVYGDKPEDTKKKEGKDKPKGN